MVLQSCTWCIFCTIRFSVLFWAMFIYRSFIIYIIYILSFWCFLTGFIGGLYRCLIKYSFSVLFGVFIGLIVFWTLRLSFLSKPFNRFMCQSVSIDIYEQLKYKTKENNRRHKHDKTCQNPRRHFKKTNNLKCQSAICLPKKVYMQKKKKTSQTTTRLSNNKKNKTFA